MARNYGGAIVIDARTDGADFVAGSKQMIDAMRGLNSAASRVGGQLRTSMDGFIRAAERSVQAVRGLRTETLAALGDMGRPWRAARERLNEYGSALGRLRENTSLAFAPILSAAAPALTTLTDLLSDAVLKAGMFAAALTGQDALLKTVKAQKRYTASLGGTRRAAARLERQLASFDRLDILRAGRSGGGGRGGSGGASDGELLGWLIPVDAGILDFVGRIRELFQKGDYDGIGRALADGVNGAMEKLDGLIRWENVGAAVTKGVDAVCGAFNGLTDGINWKQVGGALGAGVDTLIRAANRLMQGIRFDALGRAIGDGLNGMLKRVDFSELGELLGRLLTAKLTVAANAVARFRWDAFGGKLATGFGSLLKTLGDALDDVDWAGLAGRMTGGLNRFIKRVNWSEAGAFLGRRINDVLGALRSAVSRFDWGAAGKAFSGAVNGLVKTVDWEALGQWLDRAVKGVLDFGISFLNGFDADGLSEGIAKALDQVDWDSIAKKLWTLLGAAMKKLGGLGDALFGGAGDAPLAKVKAAVEFVSGTGAGGVLEGLKQLLAPGASVGVSLEKKGWTSIGEFVGTATTVLTNLGKGNWRTLGGYVGDRVSAAVNLSRGNYASLGGFVGERVNAAVSLMKEGWSSLGEFVGQGVRAAVGLVKSGWSTLQGFVGDSVNVRTALQKWGWSSIEAFVGQTATIRTVLQKWGWSSIEAFIGQTATIRTVLQKWGWNSIESFIGQTATVRTILQKWGWNSIESFIGQYATVRTQLQKWGWSTITGFVGQYTTVRTQLQKWGWTSLSSFVGTTVQAKVQLFVDWANKVTATIAGILKLASGGFVTAGGQVRRFASGGAIMASGRASWWSGVRKYAAGTGRAHGSLFVAGEAGPEVVGHVNGRTEILNRSQLAQAMYGAVVSGMGQAVNALGRYLAGHMTRCANALAGATLSAGTSGGEAALLARLSDIARRVSFAPPAMAAGTVMPYQVSAQIAGTGAEIREALDANNEDLIRTIISVIGAQTSAIVAALQAVERSAGRAGGDGMSAQQIINEINRRTQMFSASPLKGV